MTQISIKHPKKLNLNLAVKLEIGFDQKYKVRKIPDFGSQNCGKNLKVLYDIKTVI